MKTTEEFDAWFADFSAKFPETNRWLHGTSDHGNDPLETLANWAETLRDVSLADALEVNRRWSVGDDERPAGYERENTAIHLRRLAKRLAAGRFERSGSDKAWKHKEPRYDCPECQDSGRVEVAHHALVEAAYRWLETGDRTAFDKCIYRTATARCSCSRGKPRGELIGNLPDNYKGAVEKTARFTSTKHVLISGGDTRSQEAVEAILQTLRGFKDVRFNQRFNNEFAEYAQ